MNLTFSILLTAVGIATAAELTKNIYVYDPWEFGMYKNCPRTFAEERYFDYKYNADHYFVESVTSENFRSEYVVEPENAVLFIIPVLCSQSIQGRCGNHHSNMQQLDLVLHQSVWFNKKNGSDHLMMCDHFRSRIRVREMFPKVILGYFSAFTPEMDRFITSGLTTYLTTGRNFSLVENLIDRKYDLVFAGQTQIKKQLVRLKHHKIDDKNDVSNFIYYDRHLLFCDYNFMKNKPKNIFIHSSSTDICHNNISNTNIEIVGKRLVPHQIIELSGNSRMTISLTGDTPLGDRVANSFITETVVILLSFDVDPIIELLPFKNIIPWKSFFYIIDGNEFRLRPTITLSELKNKINLKEIEEKINLMKKYKNDVLWEVENSRAYLHFINEALYLINNTKE